MAPAIVGTVAVDRAIELAKRVHDKLGDSITEFKLTEDYEVVPLDCPEPGLICKITPRGILVAGGLILGAYGLWTLSNGIKVYLAGKSNTIPGITQLNNLAGSLGGIDITGMIPIVKWWTGLFK